MSVLTTERARLMCAGTAGNGRLRTVGGGVTYGGSSSVGVVPEALEVEVSFELSFRSSSPSGVPFIRKLATYVNPDDMVVIVESSSGSLGSSVEVDDTVSSPLDSTTASSLLGLGSGISSGTQSAGFGMSSRL